MARILDRLTYANVMATLAVVLVLGGSTAYAAGLAKNSVGSPQIRNGAVKSVDVKDGQLAGVDVKDGSLGGADVADGSLRGADVDEGSLGTVPNAAALGGRTAKDFMGHGGLVRGAFTDGSSLNLPVSGHGTFSLVCDDNATPSTFDDEVTYGYSPQGYSGGTDAMRAYFSSGVFDQPDITMYNHDVTGTSATLANAEDRIQVEQTLVSANGAKAVRVLAAGWDDDATAGCTGYLQATILR